MKKKKITYAVPGMMEYHAIVKVGKAKMKVQFTDGSATAFGCSPATFTTDNLMVQLSIENSSDYKRGRIFKYREFELDEEVAVASDLRSFHKGEAAENAESASQPREDGSEEKAEDKSEEAEAEPTGNESRKVVFSTNDDAKEYLEINYGINRAKLRKRADIVEAGKTVGEDIQFE